MWAGKNAYNLIVFDCSQCCLHFIMSACISDLLYLHLMSFPLEFSMTPFVCSRWKKKKKVNKKDQKAERKILAGKHLKTCKGSWKAVSYSYVLFVMRNISRNKDSSVFCAEYIWISHLSVSKFPLIPLFMFICTERFLLFGKVIFIFSDGLRYRKKSKPSFVLRNTRCQPCISGTLL